MVSHIDPDQLTREIDLINERLRRIEEEGAPISAWNDASPRAFIGSGGALAEGDGIVFTRVAGTQFISIGMIAGTNGQVLVVSGGVPTWTGDKIGEQMVRIVLPLRQPLAVGTLRAVVDYEHRLLGSVTTRISRIYARARDNLNADTTFRVSRNGTALSADATILSAARESSVVSVTEITLADGDVLDVEELAAGSTQDVAVDVYVFGDEDVMGTV